MSKSERVRIWIKRLELFADRPWYFPLVGLLAFIDLFIMVVPLDAILISSVMLQPRKWVGAFICVSFGSALASLVLAGFIQWDAALVRDVWFPQAFNSSAWTSMKGFFDLYGGLALVLVAFSPLAQFPVVAIAALAGMPLLKLFLVVLSGRAAKAALLSWGASHAPRLLMKLPFLRRELKAIDPAMHRQSPR